MHRTTLPVALIAVVASVGLLALAGCAASAQPASTTPQEGVAPRAEFTCEDVLELTTMQGGNVEGVSPGAAADLPGGELGALPPAVCFLVDDEPTANMSIGRQEGLWYHATGYYAESQEADLVAGLTASGYAPWTDDDHFWYPADLDPDQELVDGEVFVSDAAAMILIDLTMSEQKYIVLDIGVKAE